jgi:hypothetical protein
MKNATKAWLIKDDKAIIDGLGLSVFSIAESIERDPMDVVKRLCEERPATYLKKAGIEFEFEPDSEEEAELLGLTLSGVPLGKALLWCAASEDRPTAKELAGFMKDGDARAAFHQARELGMWVSSSSELDDLKYLEETFPAEITEAAIADLLTQFQPPTPAVILQYAEGEIAQEEADITLPQASATRKKSYGSTRTSGTYRRKRSYGRSSYSKSYGRKRSYARKYGSSSKSKSAMYTYFG